MRTLEDQRMRFLTALSEMDEAGRAQLLRIVTEDELKALWALAFKNKLTAVAASIEVAANQG